MVVASETSKGSGPEFWTTAPPCEGGEAAVSGDGWEQMGAGAVAAAKVGKFNANWDDGLLRFLPQ